MINNFTTLLLGRRNYRQLRTSIYALCVIIPLLILPATGWAHAFTVLLVSSFSGADAVTGTAVRDGFLLASAERDGHADETADGHLGGLDVHVRYFDSASADFVQSLRDRLKQGDIDLLVVRQNQAQSAQISMAVENLNILQVPVLKLPFSGSPQGSLSVAKFVNNFARRFSYPANRFAAQGYQLARRIDAVVRPLESVADKTAMRQQFEAHRVGEFGWSL